MKADTSNALIIAVAKFAAAAITGSSAMLTEGIHSLVDSTNQKGFAVGAKLNYQRLLGDFANSPLVRMRGSPNQFSVAIGMAYTL